MLGKTRACATVVPVLQLRVLRDKWYHTEVVGAVTVRQLKGNRETYPRVIIYLTAAEICNDAKQKTSKAFANSQPRFARVSVLPWGSATWVSANPERVVIKPHMAR